MHGFWLVLMVWMVPRTVQYCTLRLTKQNVNRVLRRWQSKMSTACCGWQRKMSTACSAVDKQKIQPRDIMPFKRKMSSINTRTHWEKRWDMTIEYSTADNWRIPGRDWSCDDRYVKSWMLGGDERVQREMQERERKRENVNQQQKMFCWFYHCNRDMLILKIDRKYMRWYYDNKGRKTLHHLLLIWKHKFCEKKKRTKN